MGEIMNEEDSAALPPPPKGMPLAEMFSVAEGQEKPEPDFLGALHTQAIPPKIIARITAEPKLPVMNVQWYWQSPGYAINSVNHKAFILYHEHGRNDQSRMLQFTNHSLVSGLDFGGDIQGGALISRCSVNWRRISDGATGTTPEGEQQFGILGNNPTKANIRTLLSDLPTQVIAYKESRFRQFDNASLPLFGPPNGFGVMQLDTPRPTPRQVWHWKENIQGGLALHNQKKNEVNQHFKNIYTAHPEAPKLTNEQLKLALYQYYNGGWYWNWDSAHRAWVKVGNTAYGDDALRIEKLVAAGTPPSDWN
jgi:hypothetical protein